MSENFINDESKTALNENLNTFTKFIKRFRRNKLSVAGLVVLLVIAIASAMAPILAPYDPLAIFMESFQTPPDESHILGTDSVGRDVYSRLLYAGRVSLSVSLIAVSIYSIVGVFLGATSGYIGGKFDYVVMRITDAVMSFPLMALMIALVAVMGQNVTNIVLIIAFVGWPSLTRLVRSEVLSLKTLEFVEAAVASGESTASIIVRYLIPNCMPVIIVNVTFGVANAILTEAALSFLGLGIQPPAASWGYMLMDAQSVTVLTHMPWLWLPPGLAIFITVMAINFVGDGLRDALDPTMKI